MAEFLLAPRFGSFSKKRALLAIVKMPLCSISRLKRRSIDSNLSFPFFFTSIKFITYLSKLALCFLSSRLTISDFIHFYKDFFYLNLIIICLRFFLFGSRPETYFCQFSFIHFFCFISRFDTPLLLSSFFITLP